MELPTVCTLSEAELHDRRQSILAPVRASAIEITPTRDGCVWWFTSSADIVTKLANLVELERQCCAFLTFRIVAEPNQPVALEIAGPPDAYEVIRQLFG